MSEYIATILYKIGGPHKAPKGKTYQYKGVSSKAEQDSLLKQGWFLTLDEAVDGKVRRKAKTQTEAQEVNVLDQG